MSIKEIRVNAILDTRVNYQRWGVLTRREFVHLCILKGIELKEVKVRNYVAEEKEQEWLRKNAWSHPFGNEHHPQTIAYNARKAALAEGLFKTEYRAQYLDGSFTTCTKTEYEYYKDKLTSHI